jgi:hypothetical protein
MTDTQIIDMAKAHYVDATRISTVLSFARALLSASKPAVAQHEREAFERWYTRGTMKPITAHDRDAVTAWDSWQARAMLAAPAQSGEPVYAYIYEYETAFGLHRQLEPGTYNGSNPTRAVKVYAAPQPAQTERALTGEQS